MNERDMLYEAFQRVNEDRKKRNFNAIMDGFECGLIENLDNAYASGDNEKYQTLVNNIKSKGIKVYRNSEGKHKVKFI